MGIESCPDGRLSVLCIFLLLYEHVERKVYGFGVEDVEITEVAEMAEMFRMIIRMTARHVIRPITECVQGIWMTARHVIRPITECVQGIWMTARHVIQPLAEKAEVFEMAEAFSKTARHVM
jgi:phage-related protein